MNLLEVKNICKTYGNGETAVKALKDVSFSVPKGEYVAIVGESGSGKSTLLNMIGALDTPTSGKVLIDGKDIFSMNDKKLTVFRRRNIGFIFQAFNLVPELTVEQNIIFPVLLDYQKPDKKYLEELLAVLNLKERRNHLPSQLSGGQQQRVGVARALAADPQVLLMDEPFGALDPVTRGALQQEMTRIHRLLGRTIVLVTHDIDEALRLAEHLVLMDHGEVVQQGNPLTMLTRPANDFVRQFFGRSELGVRLLSLRSVADYVRREERADGEALAEEMTLRDALSLFVARGCEVLPVVNMQGQPCGTLHFQDLLVEA